ncbi:MAG: mechanosensitive ion channel [Pseudomonadales bacterium]|nr:mechanosensitive ion channel [Pseudomonadales bacterium]
MDLSIEALTARLADYAVRATDYLFQPGVLFQIGLVFFLFLLARPSGARLKLLLESHARKIKGRPGLLRLIVICLRRLKWAVFTFFLAISIILIQSAGWPENSQIVYSVMLLALAWLIISILSNIIRSKLVARLIAFSVWTYVALTILGVADETAVLLNSPGFMIGETRITLLLALRSVVFLGITLWMSVSLGNAFDKRLQKSEELNPSLRVLLGKIVKITLIIIAILIAVSAIGIDLTVFTVFSGAIGVGIGFGLQKVVSNFISGIIILADRSIKPGDTISVGETFGWIRELRARFVSVVTRDGKEYLIPNEDFITQQVINWSFSNDLVRLDVPFGVSYQSDPHEVTRLAIEAAGSLNRVVKIPAPVCWLTAFGDSSLELMLRFWIRDPQNGLTNIRGQILLALWDSFKANGITIPYPHREIYIHQTVDRDD